MARKRKVDLVDRGSKQHYIDVDLYDHEYKRRRADVRFYADLAEREVREQGEILELCCGSGRITRELLRRGFRVTALDLSQDMLRRAEYRAQRLSRAARKQAHFVRGDVRHFALARRYPAIFMGFNSFEHLYTRPEVEACLRCVRQHLRPDGLFAFDLQLPDMRWLLRSPTRRWARTKFRHPRTGQRLEYSTNHDYDPVSQIAMIRLYYEPVEPGPMTDTTVVHLSQRKFYPAELETMLHYAGFIIERRFGDFDGEPLDEYAENQVLLCRPRRAVIPAA